MSMENKIDSRERLLDEVSESTYFSSTRARRFFTMRDDGNLLGRGEGGWLVSFCVYDGKVMCEHLGFSMANEYEGSWVGCPQYLPDNATTDTAEQNLANWRAYIDKHLSHEYWWLFREAYRFSNGNYTPALLVSQLYRIAESNGGNDELASRIQSLWWHFPHISIEEPSMVAYTPNPEYGVRDRQVRTKVGRYLQQFYGDLITQENIRSMANGVKQLILEFDSDIRAAYLRCARDGVSSCMTHAVSSYSTRGDYHPVDVYQTGDFKVALLHDTFNNEIAGRSLVHEPTMTFVRCYGREATTLRDRLIEADYSEQDEWENGIRLLLIRDDHDKVVVPYMDGRTQSASIEYLDGKEWLVVDCGGDVDMSTTCGIWEEEESQYCDACQDNVQCDEETMEYSSYHGMHIGPCCIDDFCRAYVSQRSTDWVRYDETEECACDGEQYLTRALDEFGIVYCDVTEDYRFSHNLVTDVRGEDIPEEYAYEVENTVNSGEPAYVYHQDYDRLFEMVLERVDGDYKRWLYQPHHSLDVDEDEAYLAFVQRYENAHTVVDDFGNLVKPDYMTLAELVHYFGVQRGCDLFRNHTGIWVNAYMVERRLNDTQAVAA